MLFAGRDTAQGEPGGAGSRALERQQTVLLELVRRRRGAPVSFDELREAGIEFPASVAFELELAGAPIERVPVQPGGAQGLAVRLDPARAAEPLQAAPGPGSALPAQTREPAGGVPRRPRASVGAAVTALLAVAVVAVAAAALGGPGTHGAPAAHASARRGARRVTLSAPGGAHTTPRQQSATTAPAGLPPTPASPALAAQLEAQGHELLEGGQYGPATQVLARAVAATGEQLPRCLQPVTDACLTYAYALYDLGRAMQLDGHPASAIPVLEQRLQIDNQRSAVALELEQARAELG